MQTLLDMSSEKGSTIVFPIPVELIRPLMASTPTPTRTASNIRAMSGAPGAANEEGAGGDGK
jgi:hypothetical protein